MGGGPARTRMRSRSSLCTVMFFPHMPLVWVGRSAWYTLIVSTPGDELLFITGFVTDRFDETGIIHLGIIQVSSDRIPGSVPRQSALLVCHSPSPLFRGDSLDRTGADLGLRTLSLPGVAEPRLPVAHVAAVHTGVHSATVSPLSLQIRG